MSGDGHHQYNAKDAYLQQDAEKDVAKEAWIRLKLTQCELLDRRVARLSISRAQLG
jgi:hypothetical protein